jgi:hypothetical protein
MQKNQGRPDFGSLVLNRLDFQARAQDVNVVQRDDLQQASLVVADYTW